LHKYLDNLLPVLSLQLSFSYQRLKLLWAVHLSLC